MEGLDLELLLRLWRADFGAWAGLAFAAAVMALLTWTSWGSKRALRKCLIASVVLHFGIIAYGGRFTLLHGDGAGDAESRRPRLRNVEIAPIGAEARAAHGSNVGSRGANGGSLGTTAEGAAAALDRVADRVELADSKQAPPRPEPSRTTRTLDPNTLASLPLVDPETAPDVEAPRVEAPRPEALAAPKSLESAAPVEVGPLANNETPPAVRAPREDSTPQSAGSTGIVAPAERRLRPANAGGPVAIAGLKPSPRREVPELIAGTAAPAPNLPAVNAESSGGPSASRRLSDADAAAGMPAPSARPALADVTLGAEIPKARRAPRGGSDATGAERESSDGSGSNTKDGAPAFALRDPELRIGARPAMSGTSSRVPTSGFERFAAGPLTDLGDRSAVTGSGGVGAGGHGLPGGAPSEARRRLIEVPEVYRSRLDPKRSERAQASGATSKSEAAVERALAWLATHQDADGRWDGGVERLDDGNARPGDHDFTVHCPPGDLCSGACLYWEADTALTGLSLLAYLGAGHTQIEGQHAQTVRNGLNYLIRSQRPDGDLRGRSLAVGMYCHAMATLALCEAYALTGEPSLRAPVERAVGFLVRSRARDGRAWRYAPGALMGDTSILGWVVLALKSARLVGVTAPETIRTGTLTWLDLVASGPNAGLASYQPSERVTPTMTAEAWVCRQFLGVGGPGKASDEAAAFLLGHPPDQEAFNLYYLYYGTLAMFQRGGNDWRAWNEVARDRIVTRQRGSGHATGSWDPDESLYGARGGRIYCTALAALTLEVYYRFLPLYNEPASGATPVRSTSRRPAALEAPPAVIRSTPLSPRD